MDKPQLIKKYEDRLSYYENLYMVSNYNDAVLQAKVKETLQFLGDLKNLNEEIETKQRSELLFAFSQYLGVNCGVVIYDIAKKIDDFFSKQ